ncbi:Plant UBX domain-containing protein 8 [Zea mays]|uniref:Plant UBX domain-containing protein 8 n=6 Tax=Zea mays TaxID=4577 RepID=A0A1D6ETD0_MAIZE|nr:Plant UBX domain-containing protein 8-like [Zea mays]ONM22965.1 Plant UBX domain-containing protein 8 [Zea mays]PWZ39087.1 Plant UBX domain-containing protein 8 [Zea mays]|eukprot:XP_008667562.1 uncharacterized protein LOC100273938 isoform X1 [Zea mays]
MARPLQEAIDTFISITGADEAVAVRKLEEHGGDLNRAINSHFNDGDSILNGISQNTMPTSHDDMMDLDGPLDNTFQRSLFPENFRDPFALMDPNFQHQFFDRVGSTDGVTRGPLVSHPREVREIPIEVKDSDPQTSPSGQAPVIEDVTGHESSNGLEVHETIIIDDEDSGLLSAPSAPHASVPSNTSSEPTAPPLVHVNDYDDDIEEEMIRAAIEASKKDSEGLANIAEQGDQHQEGVNLGEHSSDKAVMRTTDGIVERQVLASGKAGTSRQPIDEESFQEETEDVEEQPLVRRRSRRAPSENTELAQMPHPGASPVLNNHQSSGGDFPSEWGGISSEEHDEAVMLEAAMFGGVFGRPMHPFSMPSHRSSTYYPQITHSSSPALAEQRLLREQQDDEYLASLQADQEKELKALQDAELHRLEETTTREVALKKQKQEQEERRKKQLEEEELESSLASKQASLPSEPPPDAEGAVTVVVRMPDGSRQGRCFLKTDKLKFLFDFLDIGRICKPGTYRLVRTYPRRTFTSSEGDVSFSDLGLTSKQEALFLEQITE